MKPSGKKKILVLDKKGRMLPVIDDLMYDSDFDVHLTYDSNVIYDKARQINPDLLILDYLLLKNNCALVCQDFKRDAQLKQVLIIVVTAFFSKKALSDAFKCDALFIKPPDMAVLASQMEYLMV